MRVWKLQDAKARLSEVVKEASAGEPQSITLRGVSAVVVLSQEEYIKLTEQKLSFVEFIRNSPLAKIKLDIKRDPSLTREVDL